MIARISYGNSVHLSQPDTNPRPDEIHCVSKKHPQHFWM